MKDMVRSMGVGFGFGVLFSLFARLAALPIDGFLLWMIPLFACVLSALGALVANAVARLLAMKGVHSDLITNLLGFVAAGTVNVLLVLLLMAVFGAAPFHRNVTLALFLGMAFGGVYALYAYRMNQLEERMNFLQTLADKNRELQEATRTLAITQERNRMSRELHDSISQGLHGIMFALHSLEKECGVGGELRDNKQVERILHHLKDTTASTLEELRTMILELKPSLLEEQGLKKAMVTQLNLFSQRQEIPVATKLQPPDALPADVEVAIYRILQEALANVEKHAQASRLTVTLEHLENELHLQISDNGVGFDPLNVMRGNGLNNLQRRGEEAGGFVEIHSNPGEGTCIDVTFSAPTATQ